METPPASPPRNEDLNHLQLLSVFHYVLAVVGALFACIPLIHVTVGWLIVNHHDTFASSHGNPPPAVVGYLFMAMGLGFVLAGWAAAVCTAISGWMLSRRRHRMFSLVVGGVLCAFAPLGTVLGVFTIVVLSRDSVRQLYAVEGPKPGP